MHMSQVREVTPKTEGCEECLATGDRWVEVRLCLTCGHVGCCDSSKGKHATAHFKETKHALMRSNQPGQSWCWCFIDELDPFAP